MINVVIACFVCLLWHAFMWVVMRLLESVHGPWIGTCDVVMFMWVHGSWIGTCDSGLSNGSFDRYVKACIMCLILLFSKIMCLILHVM